MQNSGKHSDFNITNMNYKSAAMLFLHLHAFEGPAIAMLEEIRWEALRLFSLSLGLIPLITADTFRVLSLSPEPF